MATIVANPYYDDPFLSSIASNISRAFIDRNPGQTAAGRAHARLYGLQADEIQSKRDARSKIGQAFLTPGGPNGTYTPEQVQQMTSAGITGGYEPKELSSYYLFNAANSGQPTGEVVRAFSGTGHALGKDQSVTQEQQREIIARDEATKKSVASISAGPGYARVAEDRRQHGVDQEWKATTRWDKPVTVNPGDGVFPSEADPRFKGVPPGSVPVEKNTADKFVQSQDENGKSVWRRATDGIPGPPDKKTAERMVQSFDENGQPVWRLAQDGLPRPLTSSEVEKTTKVATPIAGYDSDGNPIYIDPKTAPGQKRPPTATEVEKNQKFPPTPDPSSPTGWSQRVNGEVVPVAKPATAVDKPPRLTDISPQEINDLKYQVLAEIGAADPSKGYQLDPEFEAAHGANLPAAEQAMAAEYQRTNNAALGKEAFRKALNVPPGAKWEGTSMWSRTVNGKKPGFSTPGAGAVPKAVTGGGAPAPGAGPKPAPQQSVAPPPANPAERKAGTTYTTPKGLMTWTGTGWVPAGTQ